MMKAQVHRLLGIPERALLREGWQTLEPFIQDFSDELRRRRYFHLYKQTQRSNILDAALHERVMDFGARLKKELTEAGLIAASDELTYYGYLVSAPNAPAQDWHVDYDGELVSIYIPMTRETERNATQYLQLADGYCTSTQFIHRSEDQVPIIYNPRHCVHRGIENSEWFTRAVFYCYFTRPDWKTNEPLFERDSRLAVNVDLIERYRTEDRAKESG